MRKSNVLAVLASAGLLLAATPALADGPDLTLRIEGGAAVPLTAPQSDRFGTGGAAALKPTLGLLPWLDANVTLGGIWLPSRISGINTGGAYAGGLGLRIKRPHDDSNTGSGFTAASPWLDGDVGLTGTGPLARAFASAGAGVSVPTSDARNVWLGPFVRYEHVIESTSSLTHYDTNDARMLIVGLELELGPKHTKPVAAPPPPAPPPPPPPVVVIEEPPPPPVTPPPAVEEPAELTVVIPFNYDSAVPLVDDAGLATIVHKLLDHPGWSVEVDGHASSENHPWAEKHNQQLSERRAAAVRDALVKGGVPADHLTVKGFGTSKPIAPNDTEANRSRNRRVEFTVTVTVKPAGAGQ